MEEIKLMKGNEAFAHAAVRSGCDGYFGYPITPQSEVMETLQQSICFTVVLLAVKWL